MGSYSKNPILAISQKLLRRCYTSGNYGWRHYGIPRKEVCIIVSDVFKEIIHPLYANKLHCAYGKQIDVLRMFATNARDDFGLSINRLEGNPQERVWGKCYSRGFIEPCHLNANVRRQDRGEWLESDHTLIPKLESWKVKLNMEFLDFVFTKNNTRDEVPHDHYVLWNYDDSYILGQQKIINKYKKRFVL